MTYRNEKKYQHIRTRSIEMSSIAKCINNDNDTQIENSNY